MPEATTVLLAADLWVVIIIGLVSEITICIENDRFD